MAKIKTFSSPASVNARGFMWSWKAYYELCKPRVVMLMLLTTVVGMALSSPDLFEPLQAVAGLIGIGLIASAAAAFNHLADQKIDAKMKRTERRPLPTGQLTETQVKTFSVVLAIIGSLILQIWVNTLTNVLTLASMIGYAWVYTHFLKRATPQNIVIGGLAGAMPPLLGWTAITGDIHPYGLLLVLIIYVWTPPHFWALAIHRKEDYKKVNIPMLPVTHGDAFTKLSILLYTILLTVVSSLPYVTQMSGLPYLIGVSVLNGGFLYYAIALKISSNKALAMQTFGYSIVYLMLLFVFLLVDHWL